MYLSMASLMDFLGCFAPLIKYCTPILQANQQWASSCQEEENPTGGKYLNLQVHLAGRYWVKYWTASYIHQDPFLLISFFMFLFPMDHPFYISGVDRPGEVHRAVSRKRKGKKERSQNTAEDNRRGKENTRESRISPYRHWKRRIHALGKEKRKRWQKLWRENWRKGNMRKKRKERQTAGWGIFIL